MTKSTQPKTTRSAQQRRKSSFNFEKLEPRNLLAATIDNPITADEVTINVFSHDPTGETRGEIFHDWNMNGVRDQHDTQLSNWFVFADNDNNGAHGGAENYTFTDKNGTFILQNVASPNSIGTNLDGVEYTVTPEEVVNTTIHRAQAYPAVATADVGSVIVWASKRQDGHHWGVFAQRYDADGAKVGGEFQVNTTTASAQTNPSVAAWDNGRFVVTWQSHSSEGGWDVYSQLFNANGDKLGQERLINKVASGHQQHPVVETLTNGNYVVAWQGRGNLYDNQVGQGVFARMFNNNSQALTGEIAISRYNFAGPQQFDIAALPNGEFAIVHTYKAAPDNRGIYLHTFDNTGKQSNTKYLVNQFERRGEQRQPAISADSQGNMVVTWTSAKGDFHRTAIFAQQINPDLSFPRGPVVVSQEVLGIQWKTDVAVLDGLGGFVVSWQGRGDNDGDGVFAREFDQYARPVGAELRLSEGYQGVQRNAAMDVGVNGIVMAWHGESDSDSFGVYSRFIMPVVPDPVGTGSISGSVFDDANNNGIRDGGLVLGDEPTVLYIIDESGSTTSQFQGSSVGDLNGDGSNDSILDAEIAGFNALTQQLVDQGLAGDAQIAVISFDSSGLLRTTTPLSPLQDDDSNGLRDVDEVLASLRSGGGTDYESPLQIAIDVLMDLGISPENGNVIFLSDGEPGSTTNYPDEVATLRGLANNVRAFGAGTGATLSTLQLIDPMAQIFTSTDELLSVFGGISGGSGGTGGGGTTSTREGGLAGALVYIDANNNGQRDASEVTATTDSAGEFTFDGLLAGSYTLRVDPMNGQVVTSPSSEMFEVDLADMEDAMGFVFGVGTPASS